MDLSSSGTGAFTLDVSGDNSRPSHDDVLQAGEIGIQKDDMSHLLGRIAARRHGNTAVCIFQGKDVVDTVAHHADYRLVCLVSPDDVLLLLRFHSAATVIALTFQLLQIFRKLVAGVDIMLFPGLQVLSRQSGKPSPDLAGDDFDIYIL